VLSSNTYPSKRNKKTQKATWANKKIDDVDIIFYESGTTNNLKNDELTVNAGSKTNEIGYKNYQAFKWVSENCEFDYIFRTNTSSYVNQKILFDYINSLSINTHEHLYSGIIYNLKKSTTGEIIKFASGSGILFNKNTVSSLLNNFDKYDHNEWEDVAIGKVLNKLNIFPSEGLRFDIEGNIFKTKTDLNYYHYRCRIDNHYNYPRFLERYVLKELHRRIVKNYSIKNNYFKILIFEICKTFYIQNFNYYMIETFKNILKKLLPNKIYKLLKIRFKKYLINYRLKLFKK